LDDFPKSQRPVAYMKFPLHLIDVAYAYQKKPYFYQKETCSDKSLASFVLMNLILSKKGIQLIG